MQFLDEAAIHCPYCGERIEIMIDTSIDEQEYIEDCSVCCRPITISVKIDGEPAVTVKSENE